MHSTVMLERRASETWNNLPKVAGSRWGFIGVIAGVAVVVLLTLIAAICCCVRRRRTRRRMGHAAQGSDLAAQHPTPSFGRNASAAHRTNFTALRDDDDENDAFVASSPRNSMSYSGAYAPRQKRGPSGTDDMGMNDFNNRYYRGSEGFRNNYDYPPGGTPGYGGYGYEYPQNGQFVEPEYTDPNYGYNAGPMPSGRAPSQAASLGSPYAVHAQQQSAHQQAYPPYEGSSYDAQTYDAQPYEGQQYSSHPSTPMGPRRATPSSNAQYHPQAGSGEHYHPQVPSSYAPSAVSGHEIVPPPYIPYQNTSTSAAQPQMPMSPHQKSRMTGADV